MKIEEGAIQQKLDTRCTSAWQPSMAKEIVPSCGECLQKK